MPRPRCRRRLPIAWTMPAAWSPSHAVAVFAVALLLASSLSGLAWSRPTRPAEANHTDIKLPVPSGAAWVIGQGYNTTPTQGGSHWNSDPVTLKDQPTQTTSCRAHYQ